jgi:Opioid growth factor receptor (OGFr) conserved region.
MENSNMTKPARDRIVAFYRHDAADHRGRTLREMWTWDHDRLEMVHDYIQWLFPLREPSMFNSSAPLVTDETVSAFADDAALRQALKHSLVMMLDFYGLALHEEQDGRVRVSESASFASRRGNWVVPYNHNHLRLTRILTSVRTLGLPAYSIALFDCLEKIRKIRPDAISTETFGYWQRAARF